MDPGPKGYSPSNPLPAGGAEETVRPAPRPAAPQRRPRRLVGQAAVGAGDYLRLTSSPPPPPPSRTRSPTRATGVGARTAGCAPVGGGGGAGASGRVPAGGERGRRVARRRDGDGGGGETDRGDGGWRGARGGRESPRVRWRRARHGVPVKGLVTP